MLAESDLKSLLARVDLDKTTKLLLVLSSIAKSEPVAVRAIRDKAMALGVRAAKDWNISSLLSRSKGNAILTKEGWELTTTGKEHLVARGLLIADDTKIHPIADKLRQQLGTAKSVEAAAFLEETIRAFEFGLHRSAVVLSWVGAVAVLRDYLVKYELAAFNAEAKRRDVKWKDAKVSDDFSRMKESDFLDILDAISVLGKNVKTELKNCLDRRNGCGHPNSLKIGEQTVAHHLEILLLNVFSKF